MSSLSSERLFTPLTRAALALGRLDQRLRHHPLLPAILFRERLEAARVCAGVDGHFVDPWHLAAELEGLKPRIRGEDAFERGSIIDAARAAFTQYQWLARPTAEQTQIIGEAELYLRDEAQSAGALLGAARAYHRWISAGHARAPMRGALVAFWQEAGALGVPLPLVGARAFAPDVPWEHARWIPCFLTCLAEEAEGIEARIVEIERQWRLARSRCGARRRNSRAGAAVDLLAAFPVLSATRLAELLEISLKAAYVILEHFLAEGIVVEVTHRMARRLFALKGFEPLRDAVRLPRRPTPGRRRGRPRLGECETFPKDHEKTKIAPPPVTRPEPLDVDYAALEDAIAAADAAMARFQVLASSLGGSH